jgi:uncharacterized protein YlbG (UPF0298 family)
MNKEIILEKLNSGELLSNVEDVEQFLKNEGFILVTSVNTFFPQYIASDTYDYTCLYQNSNTLELKAMSKVTMKGYVKTIQEVSLDYVRNLHERNPVRTALEAIETKNGYNEQFTESGKSEW